MTNTLTTVQKHLSSQDGQIKKMNDSLLGSFDSKEPGIAETIRSISSKVDAIANDRRAENKKRLGWVQGLALALAGGVFSAVALVICEYIVKIR